MFLQITEVNTTLALGEEVTRAKADADAIQPPSQVLQSLGLSESIGNLLSKLDFIKKVIDDFAEVCDQKLIAIDQ